MLRPMDALGGLIASAGPGALVSRLNALLAQAPDDPLLLVGAMLLAWLPFCAVLLASLAILARLQLAIGRHRSARPGLRLDAQTQARPPLVTRRFASSGGRGSSGARGLVAAARLALAVGVVLGFSVVVLASSGPLLLASLRG
jgi:hypothetical protein